MSDAATRSPFTELEWFKQRVSLLEGLVDAYREGRFCTSCPAIRKKNEQIEELNTLTNDELSQLRSEIHAIAGRLAQYEDVTGRYLIPPDMRNEE